MALISGVALSLQRLKKSDEEKADKAKPAANAASSARK
jgi:hypothetical protein